MTKTLKQRVKPSKFLRSNSTRLTKTKAFTRFQILVERNFWHKKCQQNIFFLLWKTNDSKEQGLRPLNSKRFKYTKLMYKFQWLKNDQLCIKLLRISRYGIPVSALYCLLVKFHPEKVDGSRGKHSCYVYSHC